jgi:hypothetical protein
MSKRNLRVAIAGGTIALALGAGVGWAAMPGDGGVIQGCYDSGGNVKVVPTLPCPKGYTALAWSQQGPKGERGDKGDVGPTGPQGQAGQDGSPGGGAGENRVLEIQGGTTVALFDLAGIGTVTGTCSALFGEAGFGWTYTNTSGHPRTTIATHNQNPQPSGGGRLIPDGGSWVGVGDNIWDTHLVIIAGPESGAPQSSTPWADVTLTGVGSPDGNSCVLLARASTGDNAAS